MELNYVLWLKRRFSTTQLGQNQQFFDSSADLNSTASHISQPGNDNDGRYLLNATYFNLFFILSLFTMFIIMLELDLFVNDMTALYLKYSILCLKKETSPNFCTTFLLYREEAK